MSPPLLEIEDLRVRVGGHEAVRGVSLAMNRERVGIVGESGAGKSVLARAIMGLLPEGAERRARRLALDGIDLLAADEAAMRRLRGRRMAMILQDPRFSLNPAMPVGQQIAETYRAHGALSARHARERSLAALEAVKIRDAGVVARRYPHQLSGGMGQRVMIAMMLAPDPDLLIADEPTSALDAGVALEVLALLDAEVARRDMAIILISHDLDLVAAFCDRVLVMEQGQIVEACATADLARATHPYTRRLLAARLTLDS
jgi:peptide/nickel transport system ATP-binding protein